MPPWLIATPVWPVLGAALVRATGVAILPVTAAVCAGFLGLGATVALVGRCRDRWGRRSAR